MNYKCKKCGDTFDSIEDHCPNDAWGDVLTCIELAWPDEKPLMYDCSPCELIVRLIDERDALQAQVQQQELVIERQAKEIKEWRDMLTEHARLELLRDRRMSDV